jgi:hypothetical protein
VSIAEIDAQWLLDAPPLHWAPVRSTAYLSLSIGLI